MIGLIRLLTALAQAIPVLESLMVKLMEAIKSARTRSRHARKNSQVDAAIADSLQPAVVFVEDEGQLLVQRFFQRIHIAGGILAAKAHRAMHFLSISIKHNHRWETLDIVFFAQALVVCLLLGRLLLAPWKI